MILCKTILLLNYKKKKKMPPNSKQIELTHFPCVYWPSLIICFNHSSFLERKKWQKWVHFISNLIHRKWKWVETLPGLAICLGWKPGALGTPPPPPPPPCLCICLGWNWKLDPFCWLLSRLGAAPPIGVGSCVRLIISSSNLRSSKDKHFCCWYG